MPLNENIIGRIKQIASSQRKEKKEKSAKFNEREVQKYTYNLDWKKLYEKFMEIFPKTNPETRFYLFEIIVRKFLVPSKAAVINVTNQIIEQMNRISKICKSDFIKMIDTDKSLIFFGNKNKGDEVVSYPDNKIVTNESYRDDINIVYKTDRPKEYISYYRPR